MEELQKWQLMCGIFLVSAIIFSMAFGLFMGYNKRACKQFTQLNPEQYTCELLCTTFCDSKIKIGP